jgi:hypothetical protein
MAANFVYTGAAILHLLLLVCGASGQGINGTQSSSFPCSTYTSTISSGTTTVTETNFIGVTTVFEPANGASQSPSVTTSPDPDNSAMPDTSATMTSLQETSTEAGTSESAGSGGCLVAPIFTKTVPAVTAFERISRVRTVTEVAPSSQISAPVGPDNAKPTTTGKDAQSANLSFSPSNTGTPGKPSSNSGTPGQPAPSNSGPDQPSTNNGGSGQPSSNKGGSGQSVAPIPGAPDTTGGASQPGAAGSAPPPQMTNAQGAPGPGVTP